MKNKPHFISIVLLVIFLFTLSAPGGQRQLMVSAHPEAATFYVDLQIGPNQCNTYNPATRSCSGGSVVAYKTIVAAAASVEAGDTILIQPGTYDGNIVVETGGTASEPITFKANGGEVVIEGSGGANDAFFIDGFGNAPDGIGYIVVEGLTIHNATRAGLRISWANHVTVRNSTFGDNGTWGVFTDFSDYTTIENSEAYSSTVEHGIYISNSSDYPIIRGNILHGNNGCGLHMNGDISMGGDGIISHAIVENNIIYENGADGGSGINMDGVTDSIVRNNLLYNNHASGISVYQIDGGTQSQNDRILNNTIIMANDGRWALNIPNTLNNKLFNNIVLHHESSYPGSILVGSPVSSGFESDYNVVMDRFANDGEGDTRLTLAEWQDDGYDQHSFIATPDQLFVNAAGNGFHLKAGSPAINKGTPLADVVIDLEGKTRPVGGAYDIGAYEYQVQAPDFTLALAPATQKITPGESVVYTLSVQPSGGFSGTITLAANNPSPDVDITINPASLTPPGQTSATITVVDQHSAPLIPVQDYDIIITGTSGSLSHSASAELRVGSNQAPAVPSSPDPANNATAVPISKMLHWQGSDADGDTLTYAVALGTANPPGNVANVTSTAYDPNLEISTSYYWQITASDGISTTVGPVWQFTTSDNAQTSLYLPLVMKGGSGSSGSGGGMLGGCQMLPADYIFNTPIDTLPVDPNSSAYINTIGRSTGFHADFGSGTWDDFPIGIPYNIVPGTQPKVPVIFGYDDESDPGPYPIPANPLVEGDPNGDGDRHVLILENDNCILYETGGMHRESDGWHGGAGAIFDLNGYALRPDTWTSADAAGMPMLPLLVRYDEVAAGEIKHAIRFTTEETRASYIWPARHEASDLTGTNYPPMGQYFRLKASYDISGFSPQMQVILQAMKTYGIILADNGSPWYFSGVPDERWDNDMLHEIDVLTGDDMEAVDVSSLMINPDSGQARQP